MFGVHVMWIARLDSRGTKKAKGGDFLALREWRRIEKSCLNGYNNLCIGVM